MSACAKCGRAFEDGQKFGGHVRTCDPERDRAIAREYLARVDEPGVVKALARAYKLSEEGVRRAIKRTGVELRPPGGNVRGRSIHRVWIGERVVDHRDRFAHAGRCGLCKRPGTYGTEHECEPVRLTA